MWGSIIVRVDKAMGYVIINGVIAILHVSPMEVSLVIVIGTASLDTPYQPFIKTQGE